ncbi:MAG: hypothetical protein H7829_08895 [Magnetococcus sp. THC-1_WYH]
MPASNEPHPWIRVVLLLILGLLALVIGYDGQRYDPGLLDFSKGDGSGAAMDTSWIPEQLPPLSRVGPLRHFTRDNLFEYVNGHAESYINAGFKGLVVAEYGSLDPGSQPQVTMDVFDMGEPLFAFGMLMNETPANVKAINVGTMGFDFGEGINFIQGSLFIKISAFVTGLPLERWGGEIAAGLLKKMGSSPLVLGFPALGEVVETRFIKENYHGLAFFGNVLERTFKRGETVFQSFLLTGSPEELAKRKQALLDFLAKENIPATMVQDGGIPYLRIQDPYEGDWFVVEHGPQILGIFGMEMQPLVQPLKEFFNP